MENYRLKRLYVEYFPLISHYCGKYSAEDKGIQPLSVLPEPPFSRRAYLVTLAIFHKYL